MNSVQYEISDNLYSFYDRIAHCQGIFSEKQEHWSMIRNAPGNWPGLIYRVSTRLSEMATFAEIPGKVKSGVYPEILIASGENIQQTDPFLRTHGFYPYLGWKGMAREYTGELIIPPLPDRVEIVNLNNPDDRQEWTSIVSTELIAPTIFDINMIEKLMQQPGFQLFMLKHKGVGTTTLMSYDSGNSTGLYMIATIKSAQRKGFAHVLLLQIIGQITRQSKKPIILHATPKGEGLYAKSGFVPYNQFFLYRFLNHQP